MHHPHITLFHISFSSCSIVGLTRIFFHVDEVDTSSSGTLARSSVMRNCICYYFDTCESDSGNRRLSRFLGESRECSPVRSASLSPQETQLQTSASQLGLLEPSSRILASWLSGGLPYACTGFILYQRLSCGSCCFSTPSLSLFPGYLSCSIPSESSLFGGAAAG